MRRISAATRAECIRLRREEQLSTPVIARKVGLCNFSVYRILKFYPWTGKAVTSRSWSAEEIERLGELWPIADEPELIAAFPKRKFANISKKASALKIRRRPHGARHNSRFIHPIIKLLRDERERQGLTRPQLAKKSGYHWMQIHQWEMGKAKPVFDKLIDWIEALGLTIHVASPAPPPAPMTELDKPKVLVPFAGAETVAPVNDKRTRQQHFTHSEIALIRKRFNEKARPKIVAEELGCTERVIQTRYAAMRGEAELNERLERRKAILVSAR